jgi:transposase-like protein
MLGMAMLEAELLFWPSFLRSIMRGRLSGVKPATSDAHMGIKATVTRALKRS